MSNMDTLAQPGAPKMKTIPLPPTSFDGTALSPLLAYSSRPGIEYDVRHHPAYASAPDAGQEWVHEHATSPPSREMIIVCMVLPRSFAVRPSSKEHGFVAIHDVLAATHAAFRQAAQDGERWVPGFSR
jgi:hypothetical protein